MTSWTMCWQLASTTKNGYVQAMALEALTRPRGGENRPGLLHALDYLKTHRWDHTLANGKRVT